MYIYICIYIYVYMYVHTYGVSSDPELMEEEVLICDIMCIHYHDSNVILCVYNITILT
jgi:hypothetical protein